MRIAACMLAVAVIACGGSGKPSTLGNVDNVKRDDLDLLPVDSELVVGIDFAQVQKSTVWQQLIVPQLTKGEFMAKLGEFKRLCGFDPIATTTRVSLGVRSLDKDDPDGVIIV